MVRARPAAQAAAREAVETAPLLYPDDTTGLVFGPVLAESDDSLVVASSRSR